jgi:hypothetical protein
MVWDAHVGSPKREEPDPAGQTPQWL